MTVLTMKAMGINDLLNFDFMDPPPPQVRALMGAGCWLRFAPRSPAQMRFNHPPPFHSCTHPPALPAFTLAHVFLPEQHIDPGASATCCSACRP
jgi:hypothetical protein